MPPPPPHAPYASAEESSSYVTVLRLGDVRKTDYICAGALIRKTFGSALDRFARRSIAPGYVRNKGKACSCSSRVSFNHRCEENSH